MTTIQTVAANATRAGKLLLIDRELLRQGLQYRATFITEFAVALSLLLTYKLAAQHFGKEGFSEYAIARRTISLIYPALLLGLPLALSRFIAYTKRESGTSCHYYGAALWCLGTTSLAGAGLIVLFRREFAYLFFGSVGYTRLLIPMSLVLIGLTLHSVVHAYYRGRQDFKYANSLQFINFAVVPVIVFSKLAAGVGEVLAAWGLCTLGVAAVALMLTPWRQELVSTSWSEAKQLLGYGIQRMPGVFALLALMTLPATFTVHLLGVQEGGYIAFGVSLLNMVGALFTPVGVVLLPKASQMLAEGASEELRVHIASLVKFTILVALAFTILFELFAGILIRLYLGEDFQTTAFITRIVALGALPFALYYVLQGLIDAYHTKAVNAVNSLCSLMVFLVACSAALLFNPMVVIPCAFVGAIFVLGFLTVRESRRILQQPYVVPTV
jgi:O-antigen/teichoic acid export membrane protein